MPTLIARTHNEQPYQVTAPGRVFWLLKGNLQKAVRQARRARQAGGKLRVWSTCAPEGLSTPLWGGQAGCPSRGIGTTPISGLSRFVACVSVARLEHQYVWLRRTESHCKAVGC